MNEDLDIDVGISISSLHSNGERGVESQQSGPYESSSVDCIDLVIKVHDCPLVDP